MNGNPTIRVKAIKHIEVVPRKIGNKRLRLFKGLKEPGHEIL